MKMLMTFALTAVFAVACGGSGQVVKVEPEPAPVAAADDKEVSPERHCRRRPPRRWRPRGSPTGVREFSRRRPCLLMLGQRTVQWPRRQSR